MVNEDETPLARVLEFAARYLKRPLSSVECQVLQAFVEDKPLDFARASQQSIEQARTRTASLLRDDEQRTREVLEQFVTPDSKRSPQQRELLIEQLLAAAESMAHGPGAKLAQPSDADLQARVAKLVRQEVNAVIEVQMVELVRKVEAMLQHLYVSIQTPEEPLKNNIEPN